MGKYHIFQENTEFAPNLERFILILRCGIAVCLTEDTAGHCVCDQLTHSTWHSMLRTKFTSASSTNFVALIVKFIISSITGISSFMPFALN